MRPMYGALVVNPSIPSQIVISPAGTTVKVLLATGAPFKYSVAFLSAPILHSTCDHTLLGMVTTLVRLLLPKRQKISLFAVVPITNLCVWMGLFAAITTISFDMVPG